MHNHTEGDKIRCRRLHVGEGSSRSVRIGWGGDLCCHGLQNRTACHGSTHETIRQGQSNTPGGRGESISISLLPGTKISNLILLLRRVIHQKGGMARFQPQDHIPNRTPRKRRNHRLSQKGYARVFKGIYW